MKEIILKYIIKYLLKQWYFMYKTPKVIDNILPSDFYNCNKEKSLYIDKIVNNTIQTLIIYEWGKDFRREQIIKYINQLK